MLVETKPYRYLEDSGLGVMWVTGNCKQIFPVVTAGVTIHKDDLIVIEPWRSDPLRRNIMLWQIVTDQNQATDE